MKRKNFEREISTAIFEAHARRFGKCLESDVVICGAGPSGLLCARQLAMKGVRVTLLEKRLAPGGGIWGGAMGMPEIVVEENDSPILKDLDIGHSRTGDGLLLTSAFELAAALIHQAMKAGASIMNLVYLEDLVVKDRKIAGVVANRTFIGENLPVDPITIECRAVVDATGHEAVAAALLAKRNLLGKPKGDGIMNARSGEDFVVEKTGAVYPGLYLSGMSVCSYYGGPRMGPIFGGMLKSGLKAAELVLKDLRRRK
ncbi:MAG TPA: sulfide-dependent adenosine diphosphate thiazole synthase [Acidobacteriota bacterium]|nr:sulfide-dependent adenosine diphosphate thiazole synthase [Acidobacteriota bacterium]HNT16375.1 sulfide-dependent adenosine diphosphate thiazole synthase [Acidobacteriota bacterium]HPA26523.1 sulfide-dependent adenosine diphosphate thiazole synthase [Acidobacteriota bacterium]HQO19803.1 sulfide-dependent adenosine diphosphate thiazole synthase [Acidobacteriota bacterium]HQQ46632.1 sulfide-dependent adenosine diphosphate thiazole synthase [Acidobacteriota bacterium]